MPKFSYRAITETGTTTRGEIDAESADKASSLLASQGYIPTRVKEERAAGTGFQLAELFEFLSPVKAPELILFTKQFNTLIRAGVPMLSLLRVLEEQTEHPKLQKILSNIRRDIKEGSSLHEAFRRYPKVFSPLYCNMLKAGEASEPARPAVL
jgi:type IV pilus assembly protein PilC